MRKFFVFVVLSLIATGCANTQPTEKTDLPIYISRVINAQEKMVVGTVHVDDNVFLTNARVLEFVREPKKQNAKQTFILDELTQDQKNYLLQFQGKEIGITAYEIHDDKYNDKNYKALKFLRVLEHLRQ